MEAKYLYQDESYKVLGACFEVYKVRGCGFGEPVYQECLEIEFTLRNIPFVSQQPMSLEYKGRGLDSRYQPNFICFDQIVVELKSVTDLTDPHRAQVHNYLRASGLKLGLLVNFGHYPKVEVERIIAERGRYTAGH